MSVELKKIGKVSRWYLAMPASLLLLMTLAAWQIFFPVSMDWWSSEDRPFEYATAIAYGVSSVLFVLAARRGSFPHHSERFFGRAALLIGALVCFFIMGEEISWGQRVIGFDTPESWAAKNYQQETTLHNLDWVYENLTSSETGIFRANFFNLLMVGLGFVLPVAVLIPWLRRFIARLALPVIPLRFCLLFVGAWIYGKYLQGYAIDTNGPPEVREFVYALGVLMFALTAVMQPWEIYRTTPDAMSELR